MSLIRITDELYLDPADVLTLQRGNSVDPRTDIALRDGSVVAARISPKAVHDRLEGRSDVRGVRGVVARGLPWVAQGWGVSLTSAAWDAESGSSSYGAQAGHDATLEDGAPAPGIASEVEALEALIGLAEARIAALKDGTEVRHG